jgi:ornithine cyclodeaminase/alanine dehydrogenase-like protein (mu-crystallin family)
MLVLSEKDIIEAVSLDEVLTAMEEALVMAEGDNFLMPQRMHMEHQGNTFLLMPCMANNVITTKLLGVFPRNREIQKPSIYATVVLNDGLTGEPLALLNGTKITAMRTGAVGAVAVKYLTQDTVTRVGMVGSGVQAFHLSLFIACIRKIEELHVYTKDPGSQENFTKQLMQYYPEMHVVFCMDIRDLVKRSEIIVTATTSNEPVLPDDIDSLRGKHFFGIGSFRPGMREFPDAVYRLSTTAFVDTLHALEETGDLIYPIDKGYIRKEKVQSLGQVILNQVPVSTGKTNYFKSVGMALFDLMMSKLVYKNAKERNLGIEISY